MRIQANDPSNERAAQKLMAISRALGLLSGIAGGMALAGWTLDIGVLKSGLPHLTPMNSATAVGFCLAAGALWMLQNGAIQWRRQAGRLCALGVVAIGMLKFAAYAGAVDLGIDRLMFASQLGDNGMAPNTAAGMMALGAGLILLSSAQRLSTHAAQALAISVAVGSLVCLTGYVFGSERLYGVASHVPMALNTAAVFQLLAVGMLLSRPGQGFAAIVASREIGGITARRLLPFVLCVPLCFWLRMVGEQAGLYEPNFGVALMVVCGVIAYIAIIWRTGASLNRIDGQRKAAAEALEQQTRRLNAELERRVAQRTEELEEANAELAQKSQEIETFVYSVSHDLRSPLVNLQGFSKELSLTANDLGDLIVGSSLPAAERERGMQLIEQDMAESIRFIQNSVTRLSGIINALLRLSRAGRLNYQWQPVQVGTMVQRIVDSLTNTIYDCGAEVVVHELPDAWGDPTAMEQVFANLIDNATKYVDPQRPAVIEIGVDPAARPPDGALPPGRRVYYVKDNGLGIPEICRDKVFQAFQRLHPEQTLGEGLGLAIVRRIVERHGGRIWVRSSVGQGATFYVALRERGPTRAAAEFSITSLQHSPGGVTHELTTTAHSAG